MGQLTSNEVCRREGISTVTLCRWAKNGKLGEMGYTKIGEGQGCRYEMTNNTDAGVVGEVVTRADLEMQKLKLDIEEREGKLERRKKALFMEWSDLYLDAFLESYSPLKKLMVQMKMKNPQAEQWNEEIAKCGKAFEKLTKGIYRKASNE